MRLSSGLIITGLALSATVARAQAVRGTVADDAGRPVSGVVVLLVDAASREVVRSLSGERGTYRIVAPAPGTYRLRTLRIGFRSLVTEPFALAAGEEATRPLTLSTIVFALDTVRAIGRNACRVIAGDSTSVVAAVWDQVRNALIATQLTQRARSLYITTLTFDRTEDPRSRRIGGQVVDVRSDYARQPWRSLSADSLRRAGYVYTEGEVRTYNAPDLDVLLSVPFLEDHCLRIADGSTRERLGIDFAPTPDRRGVAEIAGTVWLDRATSELRELTYRYAGIPRDEERYAGGVVGFTRMRNGMWAISRWSIAMPMYAEFKPFNSLTVERRVDSVKVTGGELVMAVALSGALRDTIWMRPTLSLRGIVTDSVSGRPVARAIVALSGTIQLDTTDARGQFAIHGVLPGRYTVAVSTPSLDSVGATSRHSVLFADTSMALALRVPDAALIASATAATLTGIVVDTAGAALADVDVQLPTAGAVARTDAAGRFRITGIAAGDHRLVARRVGYGVLDASIALPAGRTTDRRIVLTRITLLDSVLSLANRDRDPQMRLFEERRRIGLGQFITNEEIRKMEGAMLSSFLQQRPGLNVLGAQGQDWLEGKRPTMSSCVAGPVPRKVGPDTPLARCLRREGIYYVPDQGEQSRGMPVGCYSRVYLDNQLMNPGTPTPGFNLREIPPTQVEAMELYAGATQVPTEYLARNSSCGVLVIHLRRPR